MGKDEKLEGSREPGAMHCAVCMLCLHPAQLTVYRLLSVSGTEWLQPGTRTCLGICGETCTFVCNCEGSYMCDDVCECVYTCIYVLKRGLLRVHVSAQVDSCWWDGVTEGELGMVGVVMGRCCWVLSWGGDLWLGNPNSNPRAPLCTPPALQLL